MDFPDTPIFEQAERESLHANETLRPYLAITKAQLVGLLCALGEYAIRAGPQYVVVTTISHDAQFVGFRHFFPRGSDTSSLAPGDQFVFDEQERDILSSHKYIKDRGNLTKRGLIGFLEVLGEFSLKAPRLEQVFGPHQGMVRMVHAYNALLTFRDRPFTFEEFCESVWSVAEGENSHWKRLPEGGD